MALVGPYRPVVSMGLRYPGANFTANQSAFVDWLVATYAESSGLTSADADVELFNITAQQNMLHIRLSFTDAVSMMPIIANLSTRASELQPIHPGLWFEIAHRADPAFSGATNISHLLEWRLHGPHPWVGVVQIRAASEAEWGVLSFTTSPEERTEWLDFICSNVGQSDPGFVPRGFWRRWRAAGSELYDVDHYYPDAGDYWSADASDYVSASDMVLDNLAWSSMRFLYSVALASPRRTRPTLRTACGSIAAGRLNRIRCASSAPSPTWASSNSASTALGTTSDRLHRTAPPPITARDTSARCRAAAAGSPS